MIPPYQLRYLNSNITDAKNVVGADIGGYINLLNVGNVAIMNNNRTRKFMHEWFDRRFLMSGTDQTQFNNMAYQAWAPCDSFPTCLAAKRMGMVAVTRSPAMYPDEGHV